MKFRRGRKWIGVATLVAVTLFITNPEIFALSFVISSIGLDVFLLFLTFQLKDQFNFLLLWMGSLIRAKDKSCPTGQHEMPDMDLK